MAAPHHDEGPEYRMPMPLLQKFMQDVLMGVGVPQADAEVCSRVLIAADKRGMDTHGIQRYKRSSL